MLKIKESCNINTLGIGLIIIIVSFFNNDASATEPRCLSAKGKILSNAQPNGSTLGVVELKLGKGKYKVQCAVNGVRQSFGQPNFKDTFVCNDKASSDKAQAQITLNTSFMEDVIITGYCPPDSPGGLFSFSFIEKSIPDPDTARGAFLGIVDEGSSIITEGDYNCMGRISMKFKGELCFLDK